MKYIDKILIISWGTYPDQNGSSMIVHNLANALGADKVVVVGEFTPILKEWDKVHYTLYHINTNFLKIKKGIKYHKWLSFIICFIKINRILKLNNCSKIISVFPDDFFLLLSYAISKYNKKELYTWFHNTYLENRTGIFKLVAKIFQPMIFRHSKIVFTMSEGLTEYYRYTYPGVPFETLVHPFCISPTTNFKCNNDKKEIFKFAFTGSLNESCREAAVRICKIISEKNNCKLVVFGQNNIQGFISSGIDKTKIEGYSFLKQDDFLKRLSDCDFMILAHGFKGALSEIEYKTIFPTRTIPLLFSGKPILAHASKESFIAKWLIKNKCAEVIYSDDVKEIDAKIDAFIISNTDHANYVINAQKMAIDFDSKKVSKTLINLLNFKSFV